MIHNNILAILGKINGVEINFTCVFLLFSVATRTFKIHV